MNAKFIENQIIKQAGKNTINANKGIVNWMKEGGKRAASWIDGGTGGMVGDFLDNNRVVQGAKDIMKRTDAEKNAVRTVKPGTEAEVEALQKSLADKQAKISEQIAKGGDADEIARLQKYSSNIGTQIDNLSGNGAEIGTTLGSQIKSYYGHQKKGFARAGITLGAYGAAAIGTRYATGGSLGVNNRGESDIAGIPFI